MQIVYVNQGYVDVSEERHPLAEEDKFGGFTIFFLGSSFQARCDSQDSLEKWNQQDILMAIQVHT